MGVAPQNGIVFPAPKPPYYKKHHMNQVWIPKTNANNKIVENNEISCNKGEKSDIRDIGAQTLSNGKVNIKNIGKYFIPCMLLKCKKPSSSQAIYWHGNGEDIGVGNQFLDPLVDAIGFNVLAVEYPGYGVYNGVKPSGDKIRNDADIVYKYVTETLGIKQENIIVFGRSLGSGPATYIASKYSPSSLILVSAYTSIKHAAQDMVFQGFVVSDRFNNIKQIDKVKCPILLIHGKQDGVIKCSHSQKLYDKSVSQKKVLIMPENMGHNKFNYYVDILKNLLDFLNDIDFDRHKQNECVPVDEISKLRLDDQ